MIYFALRRKIEDMKDRLNKTDFLRFLSCPNEFWLKLRMPLLFPQPATMEYQHLREQGYAVERYVKKLEQFQSDENSTVDFQRAFQQIDLYAKSDIVITHRDSGIIDIYEIKSSGSVKTEHLDDVSFQKIVAERCGFTVGSCFVITMNGEYVRRGEIDQEQLFTITDVSEQIAVLSPTTETQIVLARAYADSDPTPSILDYCAANKLNCEFIKLHFTELPDYTIFDIAFLKNEKRRELLSLGVIAITDVPDGFPLSPKQRRQVSAAKSGQVEIDREEIAKRIDEWDYPLHFLDYETFAYAIPQFDGVRPFQQMCFQYSLHTIDRPGAAPRHSYFLSHGENDPSRELAENLHDAMSTGIGTVLVWYEAFEKTRNEEMAVMYPDLADFFRELNAKTYDLMKIFADKLYIHPDFKGRSSIKKVLPVLVPELKYTDLGIGDGLTATISWYRAVRWDHMDETEKARIFNDLEKYCELDTIAMVRIFEELMQITNPAARAVAVD